VPSEVSVDTWDGETILFDDDLFRLGLVTEYEHPLRRVRQFGNLISFSDTPGAQGGRRRWSDSTRARSSTKPGVDDTTIDDYKACNIVTWLARAAAR
jgi:hypothetical protein